MWKLRWKGRLALAVGLLSALALYTLLSYATDERTFALGEALGRRSSYSLGLVRGLMVQNELKTKPNVTVLSRIPAKHAAQGFTRPTKTMEGNRQLGNGKEVVSSVSREEFRKENQDLYIDEEAIKLRKVHSPGNAFSNLIRQQASQRLTGKQTSRFKPTASSRLSITEAIKSAVGRFSAPGTTTVQTATSPSTTATAKDPFDIYKSMPPFDFSYTINNPELCQDKRISIICYVHTHPDHTEYREAIRLTWANPELMQAFHFRVLFLVGLPENVETQERLHIENNINGDLVQGDFADRYRNLTYKGLMGLKWISEHCAHSKLVVKVDDDVFVNIPDLVWHFESLGIYNWQPGATSITERTSRSFYCTVWPGNGMAIMRPPAACSKWCVHEGDFPGMTRYPRYCSGMAYVLDTALAGEIYRASLNASPPYWIDDLYITGLVPRKLTPPVEYKNFVRYYKYRVGEAEELFMDSSAKSVPLFTLISSYQPQVYFYKLWTALMHRLLVHRQANLRFGTQDKFASNDRQ